MKDASLDEHLFSFCTSKCGFVDLIIGPGKGDFHFFRRNLFEMGPISVNVHIKMEYVS